ncbi:MAG: hypothetical protein GWN30_20035 [Gammaproteobacteria bacterium]|nr:hypothetical protein [Gammaproteobacteria bacterium]
MEENIDNVQEQEQENMEPEPLQEEKPAALTLVIQSWATPIIGIIMLAVGLLGGYFLRPLITPDPASVAVQGDTSTSAESVPNTIPTPNAERAAQQQELMNAVVERTRHFLGDPDAPVTIIEFSDFQ